MVKIHELYGFFLFKIVYQLFKQNDCTKKKSGTWILHTEFDFNETIQIKKKLQANMNDSIVFLKRR